MGPNGSGEIGFSLVATVEFSTHRSRCFEISCAKMVQLSRDEIVVFLERFRYDGRVVSWPGTK